MSREREAIREYIQQSGLPRLPDEALAAMEEPLSGEEVALAIARMQTGKAPGPRWVLIGLLQDLRRYLDATFPST